MKSHPYHLAFAMLTVLLLGGCASPQAVRELTTNTAGSVKKLSAQLERFHKAASRKEHKLAEHIGKHRFRDSQDRSIFIEYEGQLSLSGEKRRLGFYRQIREYVDVLTVSHAETRSAKQKAITEVKKSITAAKPPTKELDDVSKRLAELLKLEESKGARLKALVGYVGQVTKEIDAADEKANSETSAAETAALTSQ